MIGRTVVLFGRSYTWELYGQGVVNGETQVQWRLSNACGRCGHHHGDGRAYPCTDVIPYEEDDAACDCWEWGPADQDDDVPWTPQPADYEPAF